ncbi:MAG: hypothetical protein JWN70_994 [Planctomycetaceae bacterium]|nr:hypothetical protein [Planctomycetaceae bacterium]
MSEITHILAAIDKGEAAAAAKLLPLVYDELKRLAGVKMAQESVDHTLQATALVHEAYLRLVGSNNTVGWDGRGHFFAAAAEAMRRILIENARRKKRLRHGGGRRQIDLVDAPASEPDDRLLALDEALSRLAIAARVVELRHFAALGHEDIAAILAITVYQARQKWTYARAWLRDALGNDK